LGLEKECVAYVPQREEVDWRFPVTVRDVVMMGRFGRQGWFRRAGTEDRRVVALSLEQMGIAELAGEPIGELSGGQQQRVFLARALAQEPHVLLMDEPFTGVDVATQEAVLGVLETLRAREVTVMVSTHDLNLAATRFDGVVLLNTRLVAAGTPAQVFTPAMVAQAFGGQVLLLDGALVVDRCCPPDDPEGGR
jgi:manganese/iron transport system ATP-binding protein